MNTVEEPYSGKPNVRLDEGALGTPTPIHDDGLSPCVGNARNRRPGLQTRPGKPVLYSTACSSATRQTPSMTRHATQAGST